jgi:thiol-disulfide isomerase/thioredoxin
MTRDLSGGRAWAHRRRPRQCFLETFRERRYIGARLCVCIAEGRKLMPRIARAVGSPRGRVAAFLTVLLAFFSAAASVGAAEIPSALNVQSFDGKPFSLESLKGRIVVLDFWASWCIPCRSSFPFFNALVEKYGSRGVRVLGLTLEDDTDAVTNSKSAVPNVRDPTGAGEVWRSWRCHDLPDRSRGARRRPLRVAAINRTRSRCGRQTLLTRAHCPRAWGPRPEGTRSSGGSRPGARLSRRSHHEARFNVVRQLFNEHIHASRARPGTADRREETLEQQDGERGRMTRSTRHGWRELPWTPRTRCSRRAMAGHRRRSTRSFSSTRVRRPHAGPQPRRPLNHDLGSEVSSASPSGTTRLLGPSPTGAHPTPDVTSASG